MWKKTGAHRVPVGKTERKPLGRPCRTREGNIQTDLKAIGRKGVS